MKKILLPLFLFAAMAGSGQMNEKNNRKIKLLSSDSMMEKLQQLKDSVIEVRANDEKERIAADNIRNINNMLALQKKREATQKRNAIFRIAIGVGFLLLLIIGWRRKAKK